MLGKIKWVGCLLLGCLAGYCQAQTGSVSNYCLQGATSSKTSGLPSTNYLQGIVPLCTVTVYNTGTTNLATIYSNNTGTPLTNPFTALSDGQWTFYAAINQGYDIKLSGGVPPNMYSTPKTIPDVFPSSSFSTSGNVSGQIQYQIPLNASTSSTTINAASSLSQTIPGTNQTVTAGGTFISPYLMSGAFNGVQVADGTYNVDVQAAVTACGIVNTCTVEIPSGYTGAYPTITPSPNVSIVNYSAPDGLPHWAGLNGMFDVYACGAIGDNQHPNQDTAAFTLCLNMITARTTYPTDPTTGLHTTKPSTGINTLSAPYGQFQLNGTLNFPFNVHFIGGGEETTYVGWNGSTGGTLITFANCSEGSIEGMTLTNAAGSPRPQMGSAIQCNAVIDAMFHFRNLQIFGTSGDGIVAAHGWINADFDNVRFDGIGGCNYDFLARSGNFLGQIHIWGGTSDNGSAKQPSGVGGNCYAHVDNSAADSANLGILEIKGQRIELNTPYYSGSNHALIWLSSKPSSVNTHWLNLQFSGVVYQNDCLPGQLSSRCGGVAETNDALVYADSNLQNPAYISLQLMSQFGLHYTNTGDWSATIPLQTTYINQTLPAVLQSANSVQINKVVNSGLDFNGSGWGTSGGLLWVGSGGLSGGNSFQYTGTGSTSPTYNIQSSVIGVSPGTWALSGYLNTSNLVSGGPYIAVQSTNLVTTYGIITPPVGVTTRTCFPTVTIPSGVSQVVLTIGTGASVVTSGQPLIYSDFQLEIVGPSGTCSPYQKNVFGDNTSGIVMPTITDIGTQNISGCSLTTPLGTANAGSFLSGTAGTCTVTITPGITASHGFVCSATDLTTRTDIVSQSAYSTTTCTISGTTASGDLVTYLVSRSF